ncbi:MAG: T9SS type A sorting domain-containing protein [Bacteroidetes bacterium]|nr:T9SS type A sorting domain-containing protein [Bacteroidota bacterium]
MKINYFILFWVFAINASAQTLTFDDYLTRATAKECTKTQFGTSIPIPIYAFGAGGWVYEVGVHFDNTTTIQIDEFLVLIGGKKGTNATTFLAKLYNAGTDSLPNGSALGTTTLSFANAYAPAATINTASSALNFGTYTSIPFASPITLTSSFVASLTVDKTSNASSNQQLYLASNSCANNDGKGEARACIFPVTNAKDAGNSILSQQWYKVEKFYQKVNQINTPMPLDCDPLIIPLVVGESSPLSVEKEIKSESGNLIFYGHYPNPASSSVRINYSTRNTNDWVNLRVFDISGKTIFESNNNSSINSFFDINVSEYIPGTYYYGLKSVNGSVYSKFVVN